MDAQIEKNINYYDFLAFVQEISKNVNKIQKQSVTLIYENYNSSICKKRIDNKIKSLEKLLES
ncbi:MAG: hypothetical protein EAX89_11305 [Candidatus Lokiarchaeota archaeon]|nr:hypothetical protein [Candidatus Lokiarchaeota archaeon]